MSCFSSGRFAYYREALHNPTENLMKRVWLMACVCAFVLSVSAQEKTSLPQEKPKQEAVASTKCAKKCAGDAQGCCAEKRDCSKMDCCKKHTENHEKSEKKEAEMK